MTTRTRNVLAVVRRFGCSDMTVKLLAECCRITQADAETELKALEAAGLVARDGEGWKATLAGIERIEGGGRW